MTEIRRIHQAEGKLTVTEQQVLSDVNDELFALLTETAGMQEFLDEFAVMAARRLSTAGKVSCAITLVRQKKSGTLAVSDAVAREADAFQTRFHQGPCLQAAATAQSVYCPDTAVDSRWPAFLNMLDTTRIRSILGVSFALGNSGRAALNLYSSRPDSFSPESIRAAEALAEAASSSVRFVLRAAFVDDEQQNLEAALVSRQTIDTAVGIVMYQNKCSQADAMAILQRASSSRNIKLRVVAERVLESAANHR